MPMSISDDFYSIKAAFSDAVAESIDHINVKDEDIKKVAQILVRQMQSSAGSSFGDFSEGVRNQLTSVGLDLNVDEAMGEIELLLKGVEEEMYSNQHPLMRQLANEAITEKALQWMSGKAKPAATPAFIQGAEGVKPEVVFNQTIERFTAKIMRELKFATADEASQFARDAIGIMGDPSFPMPLGRFDKLIQTCQDSSSTVLKQVAKPKFEILHKLIQNTAQWMPPHKSPATQGLICEAVMTGAMEILGQPDQYIATTAQ